MLSVSDLSVAFVTQHQILFALNNLHFNLVPGETLALVGESGSGKSLTALALMRLLPEEAAYTQEAKIKFLNQDILNWPEEQMRRLRGSKIALIFQEPMTALNPVLTVEQQLKEALIEHHVHTKKTIKIELLRLLEEVELQNPDRYLQRYPHQLSGGEKQRVVIAMALASRPEILIADEPTTALDRITETQILQLLKRLLTKHHMSMLLITHDLAVVKSIAKQVCVMYAGEIVEQSSLESFFNQPLHPYSQQLFEALPNFDKRDHALPIIRGQVPVLGNFPQACRFHPRCPHRFSPCDKVHPMIEEVEKGRSVRCHLYPELKAPPPIKSLKVKWEERPIIAEPLLSARHITVYFRIGNEKIHAVDDVSFDLKQGQITALVGGSGCGKTTLSRVLMGLYPPTSGEVYFNDQRIFKLRGQQKLAFRQNVQIVFQDPYSSLNPRMTVFSIISEALQHQQLNKNAHQKAVLTLLDQVNLPSNSLYRYPHQFSGGQRQRIAIARALGTNPKLIICDEPTSSLDMSVQAQILNLLKTLQQTHKITYLFITHNMSVVGYLADEILVMRAGKIIERGAAQTLLMNPQNDYTKTLMI